MLRLIYVHQQQTSVYNSGIILETDTKASEDCHVVGFALFDFECYSEEIFQNAEALDCEWGNSAYFCWTCFFLAEGHEG